MAETTAPDVNDLRETLNLIDCEFNKGHQGRGNAYVLHALQLIVDRLDDLEKEVNK